MVNRESQSLRDQLESLKPQIEKRQAELVLLDRFSAVIKSITELGMLNLEDKWPGLDVEAFAGLLENGDPDALAKLREMENRWLD